MKSHIQTYAMYSSFAWCYSFCPCLSFSFSLCLCFVCVLALFFMYMPFFLFLCVPLSIYKEIPKKPFPYFSLNWLFHVQPWLDMAKRVKPVWPDTFDPQLVWPVTRLTRLKWPVLTHNPIDPTRTDPLVLTCLPTFSRLRLKCNFYKIFTYSFLLNMLCTPL